MDHTAFYKSNKSKEILIKHGHALEFLARYSIDFILLKINGTRQKPYEKKHNCSTLEIFQKCLV